MANFTRIASDGKEIFVSDTPAGLSEGSGIKNSITQPVMAFPAPAPTFMLHRAGIFSMTKTAIAPSASSALFPRMFPRSWQRQTSKQRMIWGG